MSGANTIIFIVLALGAKYGTEEDFDINSNSNLKLSKIIETFHGSKIPKEKRVAKDSN